VLCVRINYMRCSDGYSFFLDLHYQSAMYICAVDYVHVGSISAALLSPVFVPLDYGDYAAEQRYLQTLINGCFQIIFFYISKLRFRRSSFLMGGKFFSLIGFSKILSPKSCLGG